jgi:hypothetical protein
MKKFGLSVALAVLLFVSGMLVGLATPAGAVVLDFQLTYAPVFGGNSGGTGVLEITAPSFANLDITPAHNLGDFVSLNATIDGNPFLFLASGIGDIAFDQNGFITHIMATNINGTLSLAQAGLVYQYIVDGTVETTGNVFVGPGAVAGGVPEPSTWVMLVLGFAGIGLLAHRRKSKPALMTA